MGRPAVHTTPAPRAGVALSLLPAPRAGVALAPVPVHGAGVSGHELDALLQRVEQHLDDLQNALGTRDMPRTELHAGELQRALVQAIERFRRAARAGTAPLELRRRLALVSARVAAQRDALARATASLDRAIDVLMPSPGTAVYSASGVHGARRNATSLEA